MSGLTSPVGITVERLSIHTPDLDDVFLAVTGNHATDHDNNKLAS